MKKRLFISLTALFLLTGCTLGESLEWMEVILDEFSDTSTEQSELHSAIHKDLDLHEMQVHYIDVGQGDATLIRFFDEDTSVHILYDTGDWRGDEVVPYLQSLDIDALDVVIISHPHADHIGQLTDVMEEFPVDEIWMTGNTASTDLFQRTMESIAENDIAFIEPIAGEVLTIGPLTIEILHPDETLTGNLNRDSLSARFTYGDIRFLFTGDAYKQSESDIMDQFSDIEADFLHLGHHGSNTSTSEEFVEAVNPSTAIYSAAKQNKYDHPHEEPIALLQEKNIPIYGTDEHGSIVVTTDGVDTKIDTYLTQATSTCLNINEVSASELAKIVHIDKEKAEEIIDNRPYQSLLELQKINGIDHQKTQAILQESKACAQ